MNGNGPVFEDVAFDDLVEGTVYRTTYRVDPGVVGAYQRLVGEEPATTGEAPPWVFCTFLPMFQAMGGRMEQGSVHLLQRMEHFGAVDTGDELDVALRVVQKDVRGDRRQVVLETVFHRGGELKCRSTATFLWGYARP
jgi:hypothetical protein